MACLENRLGGAARFAVGLALAGGDAGKRPQALRVVGFCFILAIGVGMAVAGHPSLRTGLADFPHPALQSVSHPLVAGLVRLARAKA